MDEIKNLPPGRPKHQRTDRTVGQVEGMVACGIVEDEIASVIGIDPKTLRKYYPDELAHGHVKANAAVAQSLYRKAINPELCGPSVTAAIWWTKSRMGWKETSAHQLAGADGKDLPPALVVNAMTPALFEEIARKVVSEF